MKKQEEKVRVRPYIVKTVKTEDEIANEKKCCRICAADDVRLLPLEAKLYAEHGHRVAWCDENGNMYYKTSDRFNRICSINGMHVEGDSCCPLYKTDKYKYTIKYYK